MQSSPALSGDEHGPGDPGPDLPLNELFPFTSHFLRIDGQRLHYIDEGEGPVVIMLHGNPTWCFYYRNLIRELRTRYRVIAPDYIGCGLSDHPRDISYRAVDRMQHLERLVDHLGITRFSLVMHDWGGPIGTGLALRRPQSIEALVYLNTTLTETEALPKIIRKAASPLIGRFLTKWTGRFIRLATEFGVTRRLPREVRLGYHYPYRTIARRQAIWDFVADIPFDSTHPTWGEILDIAARLPTLSHVPVQIIWGLRDPCFHREMLTRVARHFPQASVLEIPDASHLVLEDAFETVHRTARAFLGRIHFGEGAETPPAERKDQAAVFPATLYREFQRHVEERPRSDAAVVPEFRGRQVRYQHVSYQELGALVNKYQRGLAELGLARGDRVLMLVPPGVEFLALSYAVMARGATPVFVDPGMGKRNLFRAITDAEPDVLIGTIKAQLLRMLRPGLFRRLRFHVTASEWTLSRTADLEFLKKFSTTALPDVAAPEAGLIAFTSGATGAPKGVIFTQEMLAAQLGIFREILGLRAGGRDLPLLPIFSLFNVANGVTSIFFPTDPGRPLSLEPERVVRVIEDLGIEYSFGSPTLWNKIGEYCIRANRRLGTMRKLLMAGAPVPAATLERVQSLLPEGEAYTPYGATEALPVTLISARDIASTPAERALGGEEGTLVGRTIPGLEVRIIQRSNHAIPSIGDAVSCAPREIGEVIVRGPTVSPAYLNRPDATMLGKIADGQSLWHRMGDLGYLDGSGNLFFCGRKAHLVEAAGRCWYSIPTERLFNAHPKVRRSALVALNAGIPAIVVEPHPQFWPQNEEVQRGFAAELRELAGRDLITSGITEFFFHPSFPVDARHNAKIFRDRLGTWASEIHARGRRDAARAEPVRGAAHPVSGV